MTHLFNTVRFFIAAMMLAAFALSSGAAFGADKQYSLTMAVISGTSPAKVTATFYNLGNSSYNSLTLKAPAGLEIINTVATATAAATPSVDRGTIVRVGTGPGNSVKVTDINLPNGTGQQTTVTLTVRATGGNCQATTYGDWTGQPWTGSQLTGSKFAIVPSASIIPTPAAWTTTITPACPYSLTGLPDSIAAGTTKTFDSVSLKNLAPSGSPAITALTLSLPASSGLTIDTTMPIVVNALASGPAIPITVMVSAPCSAAGGDWESTASSTSGATFTRSNTLPTLGVIPKCYLEFVAQPTEVVSKKQFEVEVQARNGDGKLINTFAGPVTLALASGSGTLSVGTQSSSGGVVTISATITGTGQFTLTASGAAGSGYLPVTTSPAFTVVSGIITCDEKFVLNVSNPSGATLGDPSAYPPIPSDVGFARGLRSLNKDGECSPYLIPYTFTNTIPTNNTVILEWDAIAVPNAVFRYQVTLQDEAVGDDGLPKGTTLLYFPDVPNGPKKFHIGVACLSGNPPGPFGTLNAGIDASVEKITISGIGTLPKTPIAIWVTSFSTGTGERMEAFNPVAVGSNYEFDVLRGDGTTKKEHSIDAKVYITPLPVDPNKYLPPPGLQTGDPTNFFYGKQVPMCIISEKWEATGGTLLRPTIDVFDVGDGGISRFSE